MRRHRQCRPVGRLASAPALSLLAATLFLEEHRDMADEKFGILVERAVVGVGVENELRVWNLPLQDERIHRVDDHVAATVDDECRLSECGAV